MSEPLRFELADAEPRLVLGWISEDFGPTLPALAGGGPAGTPWDGPVLFEETRERAEHTAAEVAKADKAAVREGRLRALFDRVADWPSRTDD